MAQYDIGEMAVPAAALGAVGWGIARVVGGKRAAMAGAAVGAALGVGGVALAQSRSAREDAGMIWQKSAKILNKIDLTNDQKAAEARAARDAAPVDPATL